MLHRLPLRKLAGIAAAAALLALLAYAELALDWRAASAHQVVRFTMGVSHGVDLAELRGYEAAMTNKYGPTVSTILPFDTGIAEVRLNGALVETNAELRQIDGVDGLFLLGSDDDIRSRFPFDVSTRQVMASSKSSIAAGLRRRLKKSPAVWLDFADKDWTFDHCVARPKDLGLGWVGTALRLRGGTACIAGWHGKEAGRMLIGTAVADGDPWMRPFSRRICRAITEATLQQLAAEGVDQPTHAACLLVDRPAYRSARKSLVVDAYAVAAGGELRRMDFNRSPPP
ncbi:exported hypothetical protein [Bradyrhizobium sp. ORS 375]|uniref:hypothetical protein n=1 Tax=Bradyrhizobium sp. (strain ORS 375) TaxID=566679 RepID=UPI0002408043|nr:hypothetical protein [Bradyrhizobium sp. ORS 375]CCD93788.1 exported hypothetical protein [Bradyrhizobium sp. ORS 375]